MSWRTACGFLVSIGLCGLVSGAAPSPVADAAERRDRAKVEQLLRGGAAVDAPQVDGTTALHWAAYYDEAQIAGSLVKAGANVNVVNRYGIPPLALACSQGSAVVAKILLEAGADPKVRMNGGETMLMLAARSGNLELTRMLLARGADPNARERAGQTALMWAAAEGHTAVIRALLDAGADWKAKSESEFTAFLFAVRQGNLDSARALIAAGADVNALVSRGRASAATRTIPLMLAVQNGHFELAIALIDAGANPNDLRTGFTALHMLPGVRKPDSSDGSDGAPAQGAGGLTSLDFVREIVKRGADVNLRLPKGTPKMPATSSQIATEGATPMLFAADRSDVPLMRLLLDLGADPLIPNFNNTTPLMAAAGLGTKEAMEEAGEESEALEAVNLLLDRGADIDGVDNNGDTAMHGAAENMYPRVVNLLAQRGANPAIWNRPNKQGRTPLFIAEGYVGSELRPDPPTIAAVTRLMVAAGLPTDGPRPKVIDSYEKQPAKAASTDQ